MLDPPVRGLSTNRRVAPRVSMGTMHSSHLHVG
jgi:hypothetical protein